MPRAPPYSRRESSISVAIGPNPAMNRTFMPPPMTCSLSRVISPEIVTGFRAAPVVACGRTPASARTHDARLLRHLHAAHHRRGLQRHRGPRQRLGLAHLPSRRGVRTSKPLQLNPLPTRHLQSPSRSHHPTHTTTDHYLSDTPLGKPRPTVTAELRSILHGRSACIAVEPLKRR